MASEILALDGLRSDNLPAPRLRSDLNIVRYRSGPPGEDPLAGAQAMIASGVVVYVSCQPIDFRKGAAFLMAMARDSGLDPFSGALYVFRSTRTNRVRIVLLYGSSSSSNQIHEEDGFCWAAATAARKRKRSLN